MPHVIERASTGRAICRACNSKIAAGLLRFGERLPNPYAEDGGEMTRWYHIACAAYMRPEPFLETLPSAADEVPDRELLEHEASLGAAHRRLPRVNGIERAASARAACRHCREPIAKGAWRISLMYYEDGRFTPSGYIHVKCARPHLETIEVIPRLKHFSPAITEGDLVEVQKELDGQDTPGA
jgi:ribosomal protein L37AE/L43A